MTQEDKIEYIKLGIAQKSLTTTNGSFFVNFNAEYEAEAGDLPKKNAPVIFSRKEQKDILRKLELDGFLAFCIFDENTGLAIIVPADKDIEKLSLKNGELIFNKNTGYIRLNNTEYTFNPKSNEYRIIKILIKNKDNQATYDELLGGKINTTANRRGVNFNIRNIKKAIGILPENNPKNIDIFDNIKGFGYKLIK